MEIRSLYFALVRAIGPLYACFKTKDEGTVSKSVERILRMWLRRYIRISHRSAAVV